MENGKLGNKKPLIQERTLNYSVRIIKLARSLPRNSAGFIISKQIIKSGTSIGANVHEAQDASSKKDFIQKMSISLREAKETRYWLNVIVKSELIKEGLCRDLSKETDEIIAILTTIVKKSKES